MTPGHWVIGVLLNNQWSIGGNPLRSPVNTFLAQPFLNYNMAHGWYLTTAPIITSNWLAASGQQWTVPIGGGVGRLFRVGDQPVNASISGYYNAIRPTGTPAWQLRLLSRFCSRSNDVAAWRPPPKLAPRCPGVIKFREPVLTVSRGHSVPYAAVLLNGGCPTYPTDIRQTANDSSERTFRVR